MTIELNEFLAPANNLLNIILILFRLYLENHKQISSGSPHPAVTISGIACHIDRAALASNTLTRLTFSLQPCSLSILSWWADSTFSPRACNMSTISRILEVRCWLADCWLHRKNHLRNATRRLPSWSKALAIRSVDRSAIWDWKNKSTPWIHDQTLS